MHDIGLVSLISGVVAQLVKWPLALLREGRATPSLLLSTGGMPSSHTAVVTTLCLLVAEQDGIGSPLFSVVLIYGLYVVLEATGLRQEVGKQARLINELVDEMLTTHQVDRRRLRELTGHTWAEVGGGIICGAVVFWVDRLLRGA
jgi:acid phosphatase family membrane protein YuiD